MHARSDLVMQVLGGHSISPDRDPADTVRTGIPAQTFRINNNDERFGDGVKTRAGIWEKYKNGNSVYEKKGDNVYVFSAEFREGINIPGAYSLTHGLLLSRTTAYGSAKTRKQQGKAKS